MILTQLDQNGNGTRIMRFVVAYSSDRMVPGVEQEPKGLVIVQEKELRETSIRLRKEVEKGKSECPR